MYFKVSPSAPRTSFVPVQEEGVLLELSYDTGYYQIIDVLGAALQLPDSSYLRLTEIDHKTGLPAE